LKLSERRAGQVNRLACQRQEIVPMILIQHRFSRFEGG